MIILNIISLQINKYKQWKIISIQEDFDNLFNDIKNQQDNTEFKQKRIEFLQNNLIDNRTQSINEQFINHTVDNFILQNIESIQFKQDQLYILISNQLTLDAQNTSLTKYAYNQISQLSRFQDDQKLYLIFTFMMLDLRSFTKQFLLLWNKQDLNIRLRYVLVLYVLNILNNYKCTEQIEIYKPVILQQVNSQLLPPDTYWLTQQQLQFIQEQFSVIQPKQLLTYIVNIINYEEKDNKTANLFNQKELVSLQQAIKLQKDISNQLIQQQYVQISSQKYKRDINTLIRQNIFIFNPQYIIKSLNTSDSKLSSQNLKTLNVYCRLMINSDIQFDQYIIISEQQYAMYQQALIQAFEQQVCSLSDIRKRFLLSNFISTVQQNQDQIIIQNNNNQNQQEIQTQLLMFLIYIGKYSLKTTENIVFSTQSFIQKKVVENSIYFFNLIDIQSLFHLADKIPDNRCFSIIPFLILKQIDQIPKKIRNNYTVLEIQCLEIIMQMYSSIDLKDFQIYEKYKQQYILRYENAFQQLLLNEISPLYDMTKTQFQFFTMIIKLQCHFYDNVETIIQECMEIIDKIDSIKNSKLNCNYLYCMMIEVLLQQQDYQKLPIFTQFVQFIDKKCNKEIKEDNILISLLKKIVLITQRDQNSLVMLLNQLEINDQNYDEFTTFTQNKFSLKARGRQPYCEKIVVQPLQLNDEWTKYIKQKINKKTKSQSQQNEDLSQHQSQ